MIPYADFLYFGILLYPLLPALLFGLLLGARFGGWFMRIWILLATAGMLALQYSGTVQITPQSTLPVLALVAGYALVELVLAFAFLQVRSRTRGQRGFFYAAILLALLPLAVVKLSPWLAAPENALGFVGISYLTFRALDVIICIQDKLITSLSPIQYLAYLLFFPTISSGPIDRYRRFAVDWKHSRTRAEVLQDLDGAVHRIFTGFLYKFILAALIKQYLMDPLAPQSDWRSIWLYMYAYSFYLFFDFAGYSAFAIGVSYILGIHSPENFNKPFLARNIRDFWNRWHMSLSYWFRDHVYMRIVMAATRGRWFKDRSMGSYLAFIVSFGLMGLWHGTQLHYILYGFYHAFLLIGNDLFSRWNRTRKLVGEGPLWRCCSVLITFHVVAFGFLLFSGRLG